MKLKIFAALVEDINSGWVWIPDNQISQRSVVKIKNLDNNRSITCEALSIDKNFVKRYNKKFNTSTIEETNSSIVLNEWYRIKLGIKQTQISYNFDISLRNGFFGKTVASLQHPQTIVRVATKLGLWSIFLATLGLILGVISICFL